MNRDAFAPIWCSWVDWDSKDINTEMLLENIREGVSLGIQNFIIDDGWYGNGLDSNYDVEMDIGDWEPDKSKIPNMKYLVDETHKLGARLIIWCAPHAVAKNSKAFKSNKYLLLGDSNGNPVMNEPRYYSYCLCCKESRQAVVDICVELLNKWDFDGAKYDLFNWIPSIKCENPSHNHDITSAIEGLELTLKDIYERTKKIKPSHIIELKQNYGTPFFTEYGSLMRAGDSPFDDQTNFQRTLHIQGYTVKALNDYQSFTEYDSPADVAISIIKMMAVGVPAYGVNFKKLYSATKLVIKHYNDIFSKNIDIFMKQREIIFPDNSVILARNTHDCFYFILVEGKVFELNYAGIVFNGTHSSEMILKNTIGIVRTSIYNSFGKLILERQIDKGIVCVEVPSGGMMKVCVENG